MCLESSACFWASPEIALEGVGAAGVLSVGSAPGTGAAGDEELGPVEEEGTLAGSCDGRPKFTIAGVSGATLLFSKS